MTNTQLDIIYLISCVLHDVIPDSERVKDIDADDLLKLCKHHSIVGIVCYALESAGIKHEKFQKEKNLSVRNIMLLDGERKQICKFFEENKIWYMPLKGVYLKEYYPKIGMRQMCDNDILIDENAVEKVKLYMTERGYEMKLSDHDYQFLKLPCYNYEIHKRLIGDLNKKEWVDYYQNIKQKLINDSNNKYAYHFSDEDFYIYMKLHEYKHFTECGTGIRSLIDSYVFLKRFEKVLNRDYIAEECRKLGIADFENKSRSLSLKLFDSGVTDNLTEDEKELLDYYFKSGVYGSFENKVKSALESEKKSAYIIKRIFPPIDTYKYSYPFFYRHKILLPVGWAYRLIRGIFCKKNTIKSEIKTIISIKNDAQE